MKLGGQEGNQALSGLRHSLYVYLDLGVLGFTKDRPEERDEGSIPVIEIGAVERQSAVSGNVLENFRCEGRDAQTVCGPVPCQFDDQFPGLISNFPFGRISLTLHPAPVLSHICRWLLIFRFWQSHGTDQ